MRERRQPGVRAARGAGGGRRARPDGERTLARSITHPDFEPIWDAAEDLGMAAFAHVGFARERINPGWANNGADDLLHVQRCSTCSSATQIGPQLLLGGDGPRRRPRAPPEARPSSSRRSASTGCRTCVTALDGSIGRKPDVLVDDEYRPSHLVMGETYTLPLAPIEYLRRQVRVTPLPAAHPIAGVIDQIPPEILCFSSDYPHVEGASDAVALCERQLRRRRERDVRAGFFGGVARPARRLIRDRERRHRRAPARPA